MEINFEIYLSRLFRTKRKDNILSIPLQRTLQDDQISIILHYLVIESKAIVIYIYQV